LVGSDYTWAVDSIAIARTVRVKRFRHCFLRPTWTKPQTYPLPVNMASLPNSAFREDGLLGSYIMVNNPVVLK
jgi:hypothetical protein